MRTFKTMLGLTKEYCENKTPSNLDSQRSNLLTAIADMTESELNELIIFNRQILRPAFKHYQSLDDKRETLVKVVLQLKDKEVIAIVDNMKTLQS